MRSVSISKALAGAMLVLAFTTAGAQAQNGPKVKVFVATHKDPSGFVDTRTRDMDDSIKDVREAITKKKNTALQVVEAEDQADIILEMVERKLVERRGSTSTNTTYSKDGKSASSTTTTTKEHDVVLTAVMHVGDYANELSGRCDLGYMFGGPYRKAASELVGSLEDWVKANYTRLQLKQIQ
jgi:hypothetical protein